MRLIIEIRWDVIQVAKKKSDQLQVCADLSMRRPGFALLHYDAKTQKVEVLKKSKVDNKHLKKPHGQMLGEIAKELKTYLKSSDDLILVREKGFFKFAAETQVQCKVIGVTDLYAWAYGEKEFDEIAPLSVKKSVTGNSKATKEQVAECLEPYVGKLDYECDDESDAVAVGVAWLIQHKYIEAIHPESEETE